MSYPQFTYTAASLSSQPQLLISASQTSTTNSQSCCCEGGRITDPHTGRQTVCSCQYGPPNLLSLSRVPALSDSVYNSAAAAAYAAQGYMGAFGSDPSAFYPLNTAYDLKESSESWRGLAQPTACYPYDAAAMAAYPYGNSYGGVDLNGGIRRKNATRETTSTLKAWLYEHRKNPYPTKGEKIMLAIITKMTLTQVSTWFANARRRLKKENKMTWSPRNRSGDDSDKSGDEGSDKDDDERDGNASQLSNDCAQKTTDENSTDTHVSGLGSPDHVKDLSMAQQTQPGGVDTSDPNKPRIWSLAQVATSNSPPQPKRSPPPALISSHHTSPTQPSPSHQWSYRTPGSTGYHPYRLPSQGQTSTTPRNDYSGNYLLHRENSAISTPSSGDHIGGELISNGPNDTRINTAFRPLNNNSFIHEKITV